MSLQFVKASTSDALTLNGISKRAFDSDVQVGAPSAGGPPGYMSVPYHTKMARSNHLYKLTDDGLIVGGAILFPDKDKLNVGRIFVSPEHFRKGYGIYMMCVMDDVGGMGGYIDFLQNLKHGDPEERKELRDWATYMGWTGKLPKPESLL